MQQLHTDFFIQQTDISYLNIHKYLGTEPNHEKPLSWAGHFKF